MVTAWTIDPHVQADGSALLVHINVRKASHWDTAEMLGKYIVTGISVLHLVKPVCAHSVSKPGFLASVAPEGCHQIDKREDSHAKCKPAQTRSGEADLHR